MVLGAAGLLVAGLVVAGAAAASRDRRRRTPDGAAPDGATPGSWSTCSAPSALAYDLTFGRLLGGLYDRVASELAAELAGVAAPVVLEVGPGPGGLATRLARRVPSLRLTGIDVDEAMVERARARADGEGLADRVRFDVGDVGALPFPDGTFDLVTSTFSVHHWPDAAAGFAEIRRVLRPGGRAIVYDLHDAWGRLETRARPLAEAAAAGGFDAATVRPVRWPGPFSVVRRLDAARAVS
jgi:SAM-dependent methyltransferase